MIANKKFYKTSLDLKYGFGAMRFYQDHSRSMAVISPYGIFIPNRLGFGGNNGPAGMQRLSDNLCEDLDELFVSIDDILVTSTDWTRHLERL